MGRNKLETQIREKLNSREIKPSAQAWDRLDAMLSVVEEKNTKRPFGFLFIAASILVLLTVGMFLFTQKGSSIKLENNVVGTKIKKETVKNPTQTIQNSIIIEKQQLNVASSEDKPTAINRQPITNKSIINQKTAVNQKLSSNPNQIIKDKVIEFQNSTDVALKDLPKIEKRNEIIIGSKQGIKSDAVLVADLDKTSIQTSSQKTTLKVDAKNLLSQVDGEVEYTFREKILNKVNKNYNEIKVALANRNNKE